MESVSITSAHTLTSVLCLVTHRRHGLRRILVCSTLLWFGQSSCPSVLPGPEGSRDYRPEGLEEYSQPGASERAGILAASAWL